MEFYSQMSWLVRMKVHLCWYIRNMNRNHLLIQAQEIITCLKIPGNYLFVYRSKVEFYSQMSWLLSRWEKVLIIYRTLLCQLLGAQKNKGAMGKRAILAGTVFEMCTNVMCHVSYVKWVSTFQQL